MRSAPAALPPFLAASLLMLSGAVCGPSQPQQDSRDQERLEEMFGIPEGSALVSYQGFPAMSGFGQREGLSLAAAYRLQEGEVADFVERSLSEGWRELPMPDSILACIPFQGLAAPLDATSGIYTCRTAGDNVLHADSTIPVEEADRVNDLILGVFDTEENLVHVVVRSGY
jgi:hypothetical protein